MPPVSPTRSTRAVLQSTYDSPVPSHDHDRNVFTTWFRGQHAPWPISGEGPVPFIDLNYYGRVFERVDQRLPDAGLHVLATDAHSPEWRAPDLKPGLEAARRLLPDAEAEIEWMVNDAPLAIVQGRELPERPDREQLSGWQRLRRRA